jgi:hypothetical protein
MARSDYDRNHPGRRNEIAADPSSSPPGVNTRTVSLPTTIAEVLARMREIDAGLPAHDGVAVFNRVYLTVTERISELLARAPASQEVFRDEGLMASLDVRFANLWLEACEADLAGRPLARAWRPLFELRNGRLPVQYAVAGMNTHIEHDLPIAVVATCKAHGLEPDHLHHDYEAVNGILAQVEAPIRRSFLDQAGRELDDRLTPVVHLLSSWDIDRARDLSWVTAETLWALRRTGFLRDRFRDSLGHTVGMTSRALLTPVP